MYKILRRRSVGRYTRRWSNASVKASPRRSQHQVNWVRRLLDGLSFLNNRIAGGQEQPAFAFLLPRVMQPVCRLQGDTIFFRQHSDVAVDDGDVIYDRDCYRCTSGSHSFSRFKTRLLATMSVRLISIALASRPGASYSAVDFGGTSSQVGSSCNRLK